MAKLRRVPRAKAKSKGQIVREDLETSAASWKRRIGIYSGPAGNPQKKLRAKLAYDKVMAELRLHNKKSEYKRRGAGDLSKSKLKRKKK